MEIMFENFHHCQSFQISYYSLLEAFFNQCLKYCSPKIFLDNCLPQVTIAQQGVGSDRI